MAIQVVPNDKLVFEGPFNMVSSTVVKLFNNGNDRLVFRVKTTAPKRYCVKPNTGFIEPNTSVSIQIMLQPLSASDPQDDRTKHKFMVQWAHVPSTYEDDAESFWKQNVTQLKGVQDCILTCTFVDVKPDKALNKTLNEYRPLKSDFIPTRQNLKSTTELGYLDSERVIGNSSISELSCSICQNIFWKPIACSICENAFCAGCIQTWMNKKDSRYEETCPFHCIFKEKRAPPLLNTLLSKLQIYCAYKTNGCQEILTYDNLEKHEQTCGYRKVPCSLCDKLILGSESNENGHDVRQCFTYIQEQAQTDKLIQAQLMTLLNIIDEQNKKIKILEDRLNNISTS